MYKAFDSLMLWAYTSKLIYPEDQMKIISMLNEKGGSGKSTVATNLATALHRRGLTVVLVDADPQGTARDWREKSPEGISLPNVIAMDRPQMLSSLGSLKADIVIIDTPAKAEEMSAAAIRYTDLALVVIQPSGADIWACAPTVKMLKAKINVGGKIDVAFLTNRTTKNTKLTREVEGGEWNGYDFNQLTATLGNRTVYAQALTDGLSVYDHQNRDAISDMDKVIAELTEARWL
jgi:chromosome partitioning protein